MLFIVVFCFAIVMVTSTKITYTIESFTTDGNPCINDCVNNVCIQEWLGPNVSCNPGNKLALSYFTVQQKTPRKWCISRCSRFHGKLDLTWCYVTDDEWDYCSAENVDLLVFDLGVTKSHRPCLHECRYHDSTYAWCKHEGNPFSWDYCEPGLYKYGMHSITVDGLGCTGLCGKYGDSPSNYCVDDKLKWKRCAPPALDMSLFKEKFKKCKSTWNGLLCRTANEQRENISSLCERFTCPGIIKCGYVADRAESLERSGGFLYYQKVNESRNPIYAYTVMLPALKDDPTLPMVVRARVTNETVRVPKSSNSNSIPYKVHKHVQRMRMQGDRYDGSDDEEGRLIGSILGGPDEFYNFVPQAQRLNVEDGSQWYPIEKYVRHFIHNTGGWSEITIVLFYNDVPDTPRPEGFALNVALYYPNNTLHEQCNDKYYSNDPVVIIDS